MTTKATTGLSKTSPLAIGLLILIVVCCCLPMSFPIGAIVTNEFQLYKFKTNLYNFALPEQTHVVNRNAFVSLMGNGNHCDFIVEQTMTTNLSRQEIEQYYKKLWFPPARSDPQIPDGLDIAVQRSLVPLGLEFLNVTQSGQLLFKISLYDVDYPPGLDFRCH